MNLLLIYLTRQCSYQKNLNTVERKQVGCYGANLKSMKNQFTRLCPFCEGYIDYFSDECPYCASHLDKVEEIKDYKPIYQNKEQEPIVRLIPQQIPKNGAFLIIAGGMFLPTSLFLWILGGGRDLSVTIHTGFMPYIAFLGLILLSFGFYREKIPKV